MVCPESWARSSFGRLHCVIGQSGAAMSSDRGGMTTASQQTPFPPGQSHVHVPLALIEDSSFVNDVAAKISLPLVVSAGIIDGLVEIGPYLANRTTFSGPYFGATNHRSARTSVDSVARIATA